MMRDAKQCMCTIHRCGHWNPPDSIFCEMCGCRLEVSGERVIALLNLAGNTVTLEFVEGAVKEFGRADLLNLLDDVEKARFISRRHFAIKLEGGKFLIQDLGSKNGTKVNGNDIRGRGWVNLNSGDKITLADEVELVFTR